MPPNTSSRKVLWVGALLLLIIASCLGYAIHGMATAGPFRASAQGEAPPVAQAGAPAPPTGPAPSPDPGPQVWVNTKTGVYHRPGSRWYGATAEGQYMGQGAADAAGYHAAANGQ